MKTGEKKIFLYIVLAVLMTVPGILAAFLFFFSDSIDGNREIVLEITDTNGTVYKIENTDSVADLFYDIVGDTKKTVHNDGLGSFTQDDAFNVVLLLDGKKETYKFYFSRTSPSNCLFSDSEGNIYSVKPKDAIEFIDSKYAASIYEESALPKLKLGKNSVTANDVTWEYYSYSSIKHAVEGEKSSENTELDISFLDFGLDFSVKPTSIELTVKDSFGQKFFSGSYAEFLVFGMFSGIGESGTYTCDISVKWNDVGSGGCGNAKYKLTLNIDFDPPGIFWLSADSVECGGFVVLSGKNVLDKDTLEVTAVPSLGCTPKFFEDGEYVRALIPINIEKGTSEIIYRIKVNYDSTYTELSLKATTPNRTFYTRTFYRDSTIKVNVSVRTAENLEEFKEFITSEPYEDTVYFSGSFRTPASYLSNGTRANFADTIHNSTSSAKFISKGSAIVVYYYDYIKACNRGKVVAAGETDYGGNTVVIDHGLGLRSVYYCLGSIEVNVGDIVDTGQSIGRGCGKGYTDGITCYWELWVGDIPVSYFPYVEGGAFGQISYGEEPSINVNG